MLKTAKVELDKSWEKLLDAVQDNRVRRGLSRLARWASLRRIAPEQVDDSTIEGYVAELRACTLIRNIEGQQRSVTASWNRLASLRPDLGLRPLGARAQGPG